MNDRLIDVQAVSHTFGDVSTLSDVSFHIERGEFLAIVGPSGCGKTTLLNMISGHLEPTSGSVRRQGTARMIYQQDGLFPWLTVSQNIALGLRHVPSDAARLAQLGDAIELVGMRDFADHFPHQLSGGMRQRVELARAIAGESDTLLMDEPFSALDYITRLKMRHELVRLLDERPRTVVLVTHDIEEAAQLADRIILLTNRPGRIRSETLIRLPRPRPVTHHDVAKAVNSLLSDLDLDTAAGHENEFDRDRRSETAESI